PKTLIQALLIFSLVLLVISSTLGLTIAAIGMEESPGALITAYRFVDFDGEENLISFFSMSLWVVVSVLCAQVQSLARSRRERIYWSLLAALFIVLAMDEWLGFHEKMAPITADLLNITHMPFAWVVPATIGVVVFVVWTIPFMRMLPGNISRLFLAGVTIVVAGAIGFEIPGGFAFATYTNDSAIYRGLVLIEESLEIIGVITLLYAVYSYMIDLLSRAPSTVTASESDSTESRAGDGMETVSVR
ncbi:MAG: hypothetical protein AAF653_21440, partial [Chloroflexota bacterium]